MMAVRDQRSLALVTCLLAATLVGLPWADGGRSPLGHATLVLLIAVATATALLTHDPLAFARPSPWLLLGAALIVASAVQTIHPDRTIQAILLLLAYLLAATLANRGARREAWTERVLLAAGALSGVLVVGLGIAGLLDGNEGGFYATLLIGPFGYPNAFAGYLLLTGGAAAATCQPDRSRLERALGLAAGVACVLGLFLARSRGAWVAAGVGTLCWALIERHRWWPSRGLWLPLTALTLLAAVSVGGNRLIGVVQSMWAGGAQEIADPSIQWRLAIARWTWSMIRDHPWFGVGPGAFPVALLHYQRFPYVSGENPHNLYLEVAAEYGLTAGLLVSVGLLVFLTRAVCSLRRLPTAHPTRGRRAPLIAALMAFGVHSGMDLDWSFPAVGLLAAIILGLVSAALPSRASRKSPRLPLWRAAVLLILAVASITALTRFYSATFVAWGREALLAGNTGEAAHYLRQARTLNPTRYSAHAWLARAQRQANDPAGALDTAERAIRIAPADPNTHGLAGEMALVAGAWQRARVHFQSAVDRGPVAHLWFHAGLLDATVAAQDSAEALRVYARAVSAFTEERVLGSEARCLVPGDRYLLARMSRVVADLSELGGASAEHKAALARAGGLAQPDPRGICADGGRPGQTSPEAVVASFWRSVGEGGWSAGDTYLLGDRRRVNNTGLPLEVSQPGSVRGIRLAWIYSLSGEARRATVVHHLEREGGSHEDGRCARAVASFTREGWFLEQAPRLDRRPCRP
jgi:O-antigen ligase